MQCHVGETGVGCLMVARRLAYDYANKLQRSMPASRSENEQAGADWFSSVLKRHPRLSVRKPEAMSLCRATSFNKANVNMFFDNLSAVLERHSFSKLLISGMSTKLVSQPSSVQTE